MTKPRIGISSCFFHADPTRPIFKGKTLLYLVEPLAHWIQSEGAIAYLIPSVSEGPHAASLADFAADLDGLVLQGGADVSPRSYGEEPLKPEWNGDFVRDQYEIALFKEFLKLKKPVLGVCRGAQLINVALGGTLYQDIPTQVPGAVAHRNWEIYDQNFHDLEIQARSRLATLFPGVKKTRVNSVHHQALRRLGQGLLVEAVCPSDQTIEAVRLDADGADSYVYGVQWHPEFQAPDRSETTPSSLLPAGPLLRDFLGATGKFKRKSR